MVEVAVGIEGGELAPGSGMKGQWPVEWLTCVIGFATACMAAAVAVYKTPVGIFHDHELAYYVSVVSAGVFGLTEAFAAVIWMSGSSGPNLHAHGHVRRCVLCASFLPLVFVAGLGGVLANARLEILQNTGHMPQEEDSKRFNEALLNFLLPAPSSSL